MTWTTLAACRNAPDPRIFDNPEQPAAALAYCARCPVTAQCLAWARAENAGSNRSSRYSGIAGGQVMIEGSPASERPGRTPLPPAYDPPEEEAHYWWCRARSGDSSPSARAGYRVWENHRKTARSAA